MRRIDERMMRQINDLVRNVTTKTKIIDEIIIRKSARMKAKMRNDFF